MIAFYGRTLKFVLRFQPVALLVAAATLMLTIFLYIIIPKGFFPIQDTGVIQGITQAPPAISSQAMAKEQLQITKTVLADPAVASVSSFIGADGTNTTAQDQRAGPYPPAQPAGKPDPGNSVVYGTRAGHYRGRPGEPHAIPVRTRRPGCE
jgi:multidrug efflux pump subunit AcrB